LASSLEQTLAQLDRLIAHIDALVRQAIGETANRRDRWRRLQTLPGIGPLTAALLTSLFERIAFHNGDALVAFSGLDPRPCDSGDKRGRRIITKRGPAELRRLLFNAAMAFARNPFGRRLFERYRARQLSTTATYLILARKLLRIAWAVDHHRVDFDPQRMAIA
jgi:transposase